MIAQVAQSIVKNVDDQVRAHRRLLDLTIAQADALSRRDPHSVHAILQEMEMAMLDRERAEAQRSVLIEQVARIAGVPVDEVTLSLLGQLAGVRVATALESAAGELRAIVAELDGIVARNRATLEYELEMLDHLVRGITIRRDEMPTYGRTGEHHEVPRMKILDAQV